RADGDNLDSRRVGAVAARPLAHRYVGDRVTRRRQTLGERPIPALGPSDGVRVEAVVDDADAHGRRQVRRLPLDVKVALGTTASAGQTPYPLPGGVDHRPVRADRLIDAGRGEAAPRLRRNSVPGRGGVDR